jgi:dihydroorotase
VNLVNGMAGYLLKYGRVLDPSQGLDASLDLRMRNGHIAEIAPQLTAEAGETVIDCSGCWVAPGLVDIHVHLREPGQDHKETLQSGGEAALAGGFTTLCCMPNTEPPLDSPARVRELLQRAARETPCRVYVVAALTQEMRGEQLCDYEGLKRAGAVAVSDDAFPVQSAKVMRRAMRTCAVVGLPVLTHCEEKSLTEGASMHEGEVSALLGVRGMPASAEAIQIARNALLALETGCHLHIQHLSTALGLALIRFFRERGATLTTEVTPHHLLLTHHACEGFDTHAKMNPPLRTQADVDALSEGLIRGDIDCIATDHAPHARFEKEQPFESAPFGIVGLETALSCVLKWNLDRGEPLTPLELIARLSTRPAQLLGLPAGSLQRGAAADVVVIDPSAQWEVIPEQFRSMGRNTPFAGWQLPGKVRHVFVGGERVATVSNP